MCVTYSQILKKIICTYMCIQRKVEGETKILRERERGGNKLIKQMYKIVTFGEIG